MQAVGSDDAISLWKIGLGSSEEFRELDVVFFSLVECSVCVL